MKKKNHDKENYPNQNASAPLFSASIFKIPNPIPIWMEAFFNQYAIPALKDINEGILEGYPLDDDF